MAEEQSSKCARETCGCPTAEGSKFCSEECEDAVKVHMRGC
jgi:predicted nucleic acid-binding Zn ribbon protein